MFEARSAQRIRGAKIPLFAVSVVAMIAGFSSALAQNSVDGGSNQEKSIQEELLAYRRVPAHLQSGWQAHQSPVAFQPAPDCEFARPQPDISDVDQWARLKLHYERHCYKQAEMLIRKRLRQLETVRPPDDAPGDSARRRNFVILKSLARAIEVMHKGGSSAAVDDTDPTSSSVMPTADGNVETVSSDGTTSNPLKNAKFYLERGIVSYRDGDLPAAIADFDLAIQLDPNFEDAYIDQGIAWYHMGSFDRAFDDIARAVRIEKSR